MAKTIYKCKTYESNVGEIDPWSQLMRVEEIIDSDSHKFKVLKCIFSKMGNYPTLVIFWIHWLGGYPIRDPSSSYLISKMFSRSQSPLTGFLGMYIVFLNPYFPFFGKKC